MSKSATITPTKNRNAFNAVLGGGVIGALGGLIGLGGAEFRLPLLISVFGFSALEAVIVNKAMSLIVVATALPFRAQAVPFNEIMSNWTIVLNLLAGSLVGAWLGAGWATKLASKTLFRTIAVMLVLIAILLLIGHDVVATEALLTGNTQIVVGVLAGFIIGVVAALMGVAGGELIIPTLILLFGANIKLAGSLSLAVSLPTMLVGFTRYSREQAFAVLRRNSRFVLLMAVGSIVGSYAGGKLLGLIPNTILLPALAVILALSAVKVWRHE